MTEKTAHQINEELETVIMDDGWIYEPHPCINNHKCGNNVDPEAGIHQFCRSCYQSWASVWFDSVRKEE